MMRPLIRVALALAIGLAVLGLLFWAFLNTPESRALLLALSALLAIVFVVVAALTVNTALLLATGSPARQALGRAIRAVPVLVVAAAVAVLAALAVRRADGWVGAHAGEISAWFIATLDWSDVTPLFDVERYLSTWLRWVLLPVTALAIAAAALLSGIRAVATRAWIRAACHWRTLVPATLAFVLLVWLPWQGATWRPLTLPPTWVEPALAGTRLLLVAVAMIAGAALVVTVVARAVRNRLG